MRGLDFTLFTRRHIPEFLALAAAEGWISGAWELEFLLAAFPAGCLVCGYDGVAVAFVTSVKYDRSGWLGNLIVRPEQRGQGIGSALLLRALEALEQAGTRTVWLTASGSGRPIYERIGFSAIDTVVRWEGTGSLADNREISGTHEMVALDASGWGDSRELLLGRVAGRGPVSLVPAGFLVCQKWHGAVQLGPWCCVNAASAAALLGQAVVPCRQGTRIFLDVPEGNRAAPGLLRSDGFFAGSAATLMYRGDAPAYAPERIFALASMGSMG
jgi:ribosomal protein S18 acetylase RimI-like enzyme